LSLFNGGQAFNIRTTDPWWKICIQMLMESCDIIVVDVSRVKAGTDWELNEVRARMLQSKCLFIVSEDMAQGADSIVARYFGPNDAPPVFVYRSDGRTLQTATFNDYFKAAAAPYFTIR
jgi:hypothetical protein